MLILLFNQLMQWGLEPPMFLIYTSSRMMMAAVFALCFHIFFGKNIINFLKKWTSGVSVRTEDCPQIHQNHLKKKETPTMGGIIIIIPLLLSATLFMNIQTSFYLILLISTIILGVCGFADDYLKLKRKNSKGLSGKYKLIIQTGLSLFLAAYLLIPSVQNSFHKGQWFAPPVAKENKLRTNIDPLAKDKIQKISSTEYTNRLYIPLIKRPIIQVSGLLSILTAIGIFFVVVGSSNGVNLTDGLDGLATGLLILVAGCLAIFAFFSNHIHFAEYLNILYIEHSGEIAIFLSGFCGALLGFLWFNSHPAEVFMGDTGSICFGGLLGVIAVLIKRELILALSGGLFVAEAGSVILQVLSYKFRNKKRIFLCTPLHHHFEFQGIPETKIVLRFWIIGLLLTLLSLATLKLQ